MPGKPFVPEKSSLPLLWKGVPIKSLDKTAISEFFAGLAAGMKGKIPPNWQLDLLGKLAADPLGFQLGYSKGVLSGLVAGLNNLLEALVGIGQLAVELSPPKLAFKAASEAYYLLSDPAHVELRKQQIETVKRLAVAAKHALEDINQNPNDYLDLSRKVGEELGAAAGTWVTQDFLSKSASVIGEIAGNVIGQVLFEIILQIVIELTTAGVGNAARGGGVAIGQGAKGGSRVARLAERLKPLLEKTKGLQKFIRELIGEVKTALTLGARRPIPKGLISKGHAPPGGMRMVDPFTGIEHAVTARAGVSPASKLNPTRAYRTGIDASAAEFETFKYAVHHRGEIGIQSAGHANAPGVDFVTAARRADEQMEVILNDVTINLQKKAKTTPPIKWVDEAREAAKKGRLDLGDPLLEEEIRDALAAGRHRVRTLTVTVTSGKTNIVGW